VVSPLPPLLLLLLLPPLLVPRRRRRRRRRRVCLSRARTPQRCDSCVVPTLGTLRPRRGSGHATAPYSSISRRVTSRVKPCAFGDIRPAVRALADRPPRRGRDRGRGRRRRRRPRRRRRRRCVGDSVDAGALMLTSCRHRHRGRTETTTATLVTPYPVYTS